MSVRELGVLVHGAGWVSSQHIAAYQANPATRIVAISSRRVESAARRAEEAGIHDVALYDDLDTALRHPEVDVVSVCTPQHLHCANVVAAAGAGKHIVIEKPAGISAAEIDWMREAVRRAGVRTVVSFVLRWNPLFVMLKSMLAEGALGQPYYVEADYLSHNGSWWSGWGEARTADQGVSALLVGGCHAVDAARWFASASPDEAAIPSEVFSVAGGYRKGSDVQYDPTRHRWVSGQPPMEYDGLEVVLIRFSNGCLAKVSVNADCIMPYRFPLRVFGDRGTVMDNRVWSQRFAGQTDWLTLPTILPDSSDVRHHPFQAQIDHFVDCVLGGWESHCNIEDAAWTHAIVFAALESRRIGAPVTVGEVGPSEGAP